MLLLTLCLMQTPADDFTKWEKNIAEIEKRHAGVKPGGIAFAGSSSIVKWDLKKSFPEWPAFNCGFGGSQIRHTTHFADRILLPLAPDAIVFYAGDNDIAAKRTPEQCRDDFQAFVKWVHEKLPKTTVYFVTIKPSVKRWEMIGQQKKANALIEEIAKADPLVKYLNFTGLHLGSDGKPEAKYFVADGLHLSNEGYAKWNDELKKHIR